MANIFAITTATDEIKADSDGKATAVCTVTNTSNKPMRGIAKARPLGNTQQDWLSVEGETERDFSANGTQQFTINFRKPVSPAKAGSAAPEKFPFRLDVASALNPDEQFTEGPTINVEVTPPVEKPPSKPFPWWIILVVAGVLAIVIGIIIFFAFCGRGGKFNGTWVNAAPPPNPIGSLNLLPTKLEITQSGSTLKVLTFNKCAPTDCNMGTFTGAVTDGEGRVLVDHGLIANMIIIKEEPDGKLKVRVESVPRYPGLTVSPATADYSFVKQVPANSQAQANTNQAVP